MTAIKLRRDVINGNFFTVGAKNRSTAAVSQQNQYKGICIAMNC